MKNAPGRVWLCREPVPAAEGEQAAGEAHFSLGAGLVCNPES
jgi:hypothetical protein